MSTDFSDNTYLEGIKSGDSKVLRSIKTNFFPGILNYVEANNGNHADAQEVYMDGIVVIYRKVKEGRLELTSSFYTYFYAVCKRIWMKKLSRNKNKEVTISENEALISENIDTPLEKTEQFKLYREKFAKLGKDCQKVLTLFFEKVKMEEISRRMGFASANYAKKRKSICKGKLVQLIESDPRYLELI